MPERYFRRVTTRTIETVELWRVNSNREEISEHSITGYGKRHTFGVRKDTSITSEDFRELTPAEVELVTVATSRDYSTNSDDDN